MNELATGFPILTLLRCCARWRGHRALRGQACARVALGHFVLASCRAPSYGSACRQRNHRLVELHSCAIVGIEYHLGVDGSARLCFALRRLTLMSVDAAHRVHHMPAFLRPHPSSNRPLRLLYPLNFFHCSVWELSLIPHSFLIKLWGGPRRVRGYAVLRLHMAGSWRC